VRDQTGNYQSRLTEKREGDNQSLSLDDWMTKFGRIYGKRHDKHTTEYMISRLVEEVAELVNPMESREDLGPGLSDVFSWTCSIAYKLNIDLADLAWEKYGKNPPRSTVSSSMTLGLNEYSEPRSLREWQTFISKLYQGENSTLSPMNALVAMMKDVGDLAMLNRKRAPREQITSKLAAILAWTLTLSQLLKLDLSERVYEKYDDHCPTCSQSTCDTDVCHPLVNMFVSFGDLVNDEEKYTLLDTATKFGYQTILSKSQAVSSTKDLSNSLDLISKCDAACIVLSNLGAPNYGQIFEILSCYSMLSKGNIWVFAGEGSSEFMSYFANVFSPEKISISNYSDAGHLKAIFEAFLSGLENRKKTLAKSY